MEITIYNKWESQENSMSGWLKRAQKSSLRQATFHLDRDFALILSHSL